MNLHNKLVNENEMKIEIRNFFRKTSANCKIVFIDIGEHAEKIWKYIYYTQDVVKFSGV